MIATVIEFSRYLVVLLFGTLVAVNFAGMARTRKNYLAVGCFALSSFLLQIVSLRLWGMSMVLKIYPLIVHLPVIIFIAIYLKRSWIISASSMFSSYLCCQPPRWIGSVMGAAFNQVSLNHISYIITALLAYYFLYKYVVVSISHLMEHSVKSCLLLGAVPFFYYVFDYATTIYTHLMYNHSRTAIQFMPSMMSAFYYIYVLLYYNETQKQASAQRERDMLATQFHQAQTEFAALRQMQQSAAAYRHDMRHHFAHLQGLAATGCMEEIKAYLRTAKSDIEAITPMHFCENEAVNLILSSYAAKAKHSRVTLKVDAKLPASLPYSDTELCSLFSNALENAVTAAAAFSDSEARIVSMMATIHRDKLLISLENPFTGQVIIQDGLPISQLDGHGYGTRSISYIAETHCGQAIFTAESGIFTLKIMLPLETTSLILS